MHSKERINAGEGDAVWQDITFGCNAAPRAVSQFNKANNGDAGLGQYYQAGVPIKLALHNYQHLFGKFYFTFHFYIHPCKHHYIHCTISHMAIGYALQDTEYD